MDNKYTGEKLFRIHENDAGTEAYADDYVVWLEQRVEYLEKEVRVKQSALDWYDIVEYLAKEVRVKQSALDWYDFEPGEMK